MEKEVNFIALIKLNGQEDVFKGKDLSAIAEEVKDFMKKKRKHYPEATISVEAFEISGKVNLEGLI